VAHATREISETSFSTAATTVPLNTIDNHERAYRRGARGPSDTPPPSAHPTHSRQHPPPPPPPVHPPARPIYNMQFTNPRPPGPSSAPSAPRLAAPRTAHPRGHSRLRASRARRRLLLPCRPRLRRLWTRLRGSPFSRSRSLCLPSRCVQGGGGGCDGEQDGDGVMRLRVRLLRLLRAARGDSWRWGRGWQRKESATVNRKGRQSGVR
jgi:hypothetical protein